MSQATQELKQTIKRQLATSEKFTDSQFPPQASTALGHNYSKYNLKRASELYQQVQVMPEEINSSDIQPGLFKNGYFLSAVAALTQNPSALKRLFLTEEANQVGLYAVWLCNSGVWTPVTVDDYLPSKNRSGQRVPAFSQTSNEEIWVSLLEKAYAKIHGSYGNIEKGTISSALRDLTGAPVEELNKQSEVDKVWEAISEGVAKQFLMCCSIENAEDAIEGEESEAADNSHAYVIIDAKEVATAGKGTARLVLLKNPWGENEWRGDWSNESNLWTEKLRDELKYHEKEAQDGLFWISIEDYQEQFARTWICRYNATNKYYSVNINKPSQVLRINIPIGQEVTISINQKDARCYGDQEENYKYSYGRLLLAKVYNEQGLGYVSGASGEKRNIEFTKTLNAGTYILTSEVEWNQDYHQDYSISFYSEAELEIEAVPQADLITIQKSIVLSSTDNAENINNRKAYGKYGDSAIEKYEGHIHGLLFFYYVNQSKKDNKLTERITFSRLENMHVSEDNKSKAVEVIVVPGREVLVLYKATAVDHVWSYTSSFGIQPLEIDEDPEIFTQEVYDYIDDFNRWEAVDINNDYNLHIQEKLEKNPKKKVAEERNNEDEIEAEEEEEEEEFEIKTLSKVLDEAFPEERKSADSWTRSRAPESAVSSAAPAKTASPVRKYPAVDMEIGQTNCKKIPYTNGDTYDKVLSIVSTDPSMIQVRTPVLKVRAGETEEIRLRLVAPGEEGTFKTAVEVRGKNARLEEKIVIAINNRDAY